MKKVINESQLSRIVENATRLAINRIINESNYINEEDLDEKIFGGLRDRAGAVVDTFKNGGAYGAHLANRNLQTARQDTENLMNRYGVQSGQNSKQFVSQNVQKAVEKIKEKYDAKIENLNDKIKQLATQRDEEIGQVSASASQKAQGQWDKYRGKKDALDTQRKDAYNARAKAMNANPYSNFK